MIVPILIGAALVYALFDKKEEFKSLNMPKNYIKIIDQKFKEGYGKVKYFELSEILGGKWVYKKNPNMTISQIKKSPVFTIETTNEIKYKAKEIREAYNKNQPKEITILEFAKKLAKDNDGKIYHKSKSGSVYVKTKEGNVRISDHFILDIDTLNPKIRHDFEIVQKHFDEKTSTKLN